MHTRKVNLCPLDVLLVALILSGCHDEEKVSIENSLSPCC